jgi:hypothetical protein
MTIISGNLPIDSVLGLHSFYVLLTIDGGEERLFVARDDAGRRLVVLFSSRESGDEAAALTRAPLKMLVSEEAVAQFVLVARANLATHAWLNPPLEQLANLHRKQGETHG